MFSFPMHAAVKDFMTHVLNCLSAATSTIDWNTSEGKALAYAALWSMSKEMSCTNELYALKEFPSWYSELARCCCNPGFMAGSCSPKKATAIHLHGYLEYDMINWVLRCFSLKKIKPPLICSHWTKHFPVF